MHHDWRFWIALLLTLTAIIIYVVSEDFAWLPRGPDAASASNTGRK